MRCLNSLAESWNSPTTAGLSPGRPNQGNPVPRNGGLSMQQLAKYAPQMLSILRIVSGLIFFEHGLQKIAGFPPYAAGASAPSLATMSGPAGCSNLSAVSC